MMKTEKDKNKHKTFRCYHKQVIFITHRVLFIIPSKFYRDYFEFFSQVFLTKNYQQIFQNY